MESKPEKIFSLILQGSGIPYTFGRNASHHHRKLETISIVPVGAEVLPDVDPGLQRWLSGTFFSDQGSENIGLRKITCVIQVLSKDLGGAESIVERLYSLLYQYLSYGAIEFIGEEWQTEEDERAGELNQGAQINVNVALLVPFVRATHTLVVPPKVTTEGCC